MNYVSTLYHKDHWGSAHLLRSCIVFCTTAQKAVVHRVAVRLLNELLKSSVANQSWKSRNRKIIHMYLMCIGSKGNDKYYKKPTLPQVSVSQPQMSVMFFFPLFCLLSFLSILFLCFCLLTSLSFSLSFVFLLSLVSIFHLKFDQNIQMFRDFFWILP